MAISIHIDDVTKEYGQALLDLGKYLIEASGQVAVKERPITERFSEFMAQAASGTGVPFAFTGQASQPVDTETGEITPPPVAAPATAHPGVASLIPPPPTVFIPQLSVVPPPAADNTHAELAAGATVSIAAPSPVTPPVGVTVDSSGYPWDSRIHSAKKTIIGNGTWKYRRNCDEALIKQVEYELRQTMGLPPPAAVVPAPVEQPVGPGAAVIPPPPAAAEVPPPVNPLPAFMEWAVGQSTEGKITQAQILAFVQAQGLPHIGALFTRPDLVPVVRAEIEKHIVANGGTL